jgi:hypothetical protein
MAGTEALRIVSASIWQGTYLDERAVTVTVRHDSRRVGVRTIITLWLDDANPKNGGYKAGTVTHRIVKGDGRTPDFETLSDARVMDADAALGYLRGVESSLMIAYNEARHEGDPMLAKRTLNRWAEASRARAGFEAAL